MAKQSIESDTNHQVGLITGKIDGLVIAVNALSIRFEDHLKEHRATWLWVFPTLLSLGTFIFMLIIYFGGSYGH